jgi:hypothetical protein
MKYIFLIFRNYYFCVFSALHRPGEEDVRVHRSGVRPGVGGQRTQAALGGRKRTSGGWPRPGIPSFRVSGAVCIFFVFIFSYLIIKYLIYNIFHTIIIYFIIF